jgi:hypothetical protein
VTLYAAPISATEAIISNTNRQKAYIKPNSQNTSQLQTECRTGLDPFDAFSETKRPFDAFQDIQSEEPIQYTGACPVEYTHRDGQV